MKKFFKFLAMALVVTSFSFVACTKEDEKKDDNKKNEQPQQQDDSWKKKQSYIGTIFTPDAITATDTVKITTYYDIEYRATGRQENDTARFFCIEAFWDSVHYIDEGTHQEMIQRGFPYIYNIWGVRKGSGNLLKNFVLDYCSNLSQAKELVSTYSQAAEYSGASWKADWQGLYLKDIQINGFDAESGAIDYYASYQLYNFWDYVSNGNSVEGMRGATLEIVVSNFVFPTISKN